MDLKTEDGGKIKAHLFYDGEDVGGTVSITDRDARVERLVTLPLFTPISCPPVLLYLTATLPYISPMVPCIVNDAGRQQIDMRLKNKGKKLEHYGIKVEFIGQIGTSKRRLLFCFSSFFSSARAARVGDSHFSFF